MNLSDFLKSPLLTEANVYNVKLPINGVSVDGFVKQCVADVTDPTIIPQLIKKLSLLLVNDESNLRPITNLPDDAPDWAKTAVTAGELFVFVPTEELTDNISNIAHYVQAAIEDTKSPDNNIVVRAKQELSAIPKAPDLPTLYTKANQYFATGAKKANADTEGMKEMQDYNGWIWYKLETPNAFARAGKTLQNCIGTHWTFDKAERDGMNIYVLRTEANDSVVAIRAHGNVIQEIKGKNNNPPVEKYMPYVFSFVKDSVLDLSSPIAQRELKHAGYWVFNDKIMVPLSKAVDMYFDHDTQKLHKIESNGEVEVAGIQYTKYTNAQAIKHIIQIFGDSRGNQAINRMYKGVMDGKTVIFYVDTTNEIQPPIVNGSSWAYLSDKATKDTLATNVVAFAATEKLTICAMIRQSLKLSTNPPHVPIANLMNFSQVVEGFDKIDVSNLNGGDHWVAMPVFVKGGNGPSVSQSASMSDYVKRVMKGIDFDRAKYMYRAYAGRNLAWVLWVDDKNSIFCVEALANVDIGGIANIRKLMVTEKLTIEKSAISSSNIVINPPATIMTKQEVLANKMASNKTANTKTVIEFEDGAAFKLLEGKPLTDWLEQSISGIQTDAVYVLTVDNDPVIALPISNRKITGMFAKDTRVNTWRDENLANRGQVAQPTEKTLDFRYGKYIKAFANKMGFSVAAKHLVIKPDSRIEQMLTFIVNNPGQLRSKALRAAHVGTAAAPGIDAPYNKLDRPMIQLGLITSSPSPLRRTSVIFNPTDKGREVARRLRAGESVPMFDLVTQSAQLKGGNEPDPEPEAAPVPRQQREPGAAPTRAPAGANRAGSKAQQIYALYSQMTADNDGVQPTRAAFIALIRQPPFHMTPAGASTYQYNMRTKYLQQHGQLGETFTFKEWLIAML